VLALLSARGFVRRRFDVEVPAHHLLSTLELFDGLERTYRLLADDYSRQALLDVLRYRILGERHVRLPLNDEHFWAEYNSVDARFLKERRTIKAWWGWDFHLYELPEDRGGPLRLHSNLLGILQTFLLEQYAYRRGGQCIRAKEGDVVIDGGGCTGDTALYFAARVGARGKVYCFEFEERNLDVLRQNLALNPHLEGIVEIVPAALWEESGIALSYDPDGPATTVALRQGQPAGAQAATLSIDDLVSREALAKVDFIKMDIEGAELQALKGAERTLRAFRPTLAISIYHQADDFVTIPEYLDGLGLGYEFFLDHFTIYNAETVLFARPKSRQG
jgi:FkbM family methyltransferase